MITSKVIAEILEDDEIATTKSNRNMNSQTIRQVYRKQTNGLFNQPSLYLEEVHLKYRY